MNIHISWLEHFFKYFLAWISLGLNFSLSIPLLLCLFKKKWKILFCNLAWILLCCNITNNQIVCTNIHILLLEHFFKYFLAWISLGLNFSLNISLLFCLFKTEKLWALYDYTKDQRGCLNIHAVCYASMLLQCCAWPRGIFTYLSKYNNYFSKLIQYLP